jgi:uncharacterized DUF497 family protein
MRYEWDERKNLANQRKHGISFELALTVFSDPHCMFGLDQVDQSGEQRWHAVGFASIEPGVGDVLLVAHVYREDEHGEEIVRIISARRASDDDFGRYQEQALD